MTNVGNQEVGGGAQTIYVEEYEWYEETDRALYGFHAEQNVRYSSDGAYTIDPHQIPVFLTDSVSVSRVD